MNLLVGMAISNITKTFQNSGLLRLKMTIEMIKILEDLMVSVFKCLPFLIRGLQIVPNKFQYDFIF